MPRTQVDKDYMAIARRRVTRPSKQESYRRVLIYARNKKGKSRFGLSGGVGSTLVIDPEHGTDTMKALDPYVWHVAKWTELQEVWGFLRMGGCSPKDLDLGPETEPFSIVSVDGTTRMNNMALKYIMGLAEKTDLTRKPGIVQRPDYNKSGELMKQMMLNLHTLPMHVIYTAQERIVVSEDSDDETEEAKTFYVPNLPQGVRGELNSIVDVIGRLYTATVTLKKPGGGTQEKKQRRLFVGLHEAYDTGYRSDFVLPDIVKNPTFPKLTNLMLTGAEKEKV